MQPRGLFASLVSTVRRHMPAHEPARQSSRPVACAAEALEGRVMFALAESIGGSGYSGTLSSDPTTRKQQLICDPAEPREGSTSVTYDPEAVHLVGFAPGPGYNNLGFIGYVEVRPWGATSGTVLQPLVAYLKNPLGTEVGFVQVHYKLGLGDPNKPGQITPAYGPGNVVEEAGVSGIDTHALEFVPVDKTKPANYTIFPATAGTHGNNQEDYLVVNNAAQTRLGPANLTPAFVSMNPAPVVQPVAPPPIAEGSSLALTAVATDKNAAGEDTSGSLTYSWDLDSNGTEDATGPNPTLTWAALETKLRSLADGTRTLTGRLTVTDNNSRTTTANTSVTINNAVPTVGVVASDGTSLTQTKLTLTATDPAATDRAAGFEYVIDWGDGAVQTISRTAGNGSGLAPVDHTYGNVVPFAINVYAVDKDGGKSATVNVQVARRGAYLRDDPAYPTKKALYVVGSNGSDVIRLDKAATGMKVTITTPGLTTYSVTFKEQFGRVIAYGLGGNDNIFFGTSAAADAVFFGGDGNDTLTAGNYLTILSGDEGSDTLSSGNAKDLLIGGGGGDTLKGGDGDDLLVAGRTKYEAETADNEVRALTSILKEWVGPSSYETRIAHLTGAAGGGLNGSALLKPGTSVFDDGEKDFLYGGNGRDWLLLKRQLTGVFDSHDLISTETGTELL